NCPPMKLSRHPYEPSALLDFFQQGLDSLGAVCERTWHDRLQVLAEGRAGRLWQADKALVEKELEFLSPDAPSVKEADTQVFPGCPLTFRLAEELRPFPLTLEKI